MADAVATSEAALDPTVASYRRIFDPQQYAVIPNVPIYKEHVRKLKNGRELKIDKEKLEYIAALKNKKEAETLSLAPIGPGHTKDDAPETAQPPIWGYQRRWRVAYDKREGLWKLYVDWHVKRHIRGSDGATLDGVEAVKSYPRRSVEIWPQDLDVDYTALLRSTPELDLGIVDYSAGTGVERYQRSRDGEKLRYEETPMADDMDPTTPPTAAVPPPPTDDGGLATEPPEHQEAAERYGKHFFHHVLGMPHHHAKSLLNHLKMRYGKEAGIADGDGDADDMVPPAAPAASPEQYDAGPGVAGATNAFIPGADEKKEKARMQKAQADIEKSRYQRELDELKQQLATERDARLAMEGRERKARYERDLSQILAEGYQFDLAEEVNEVAEFDTARFEAHKARIKKRYQKAPVGLPTIPGLGTPPVSAAREATKEQVQRAVKRAKGDPELYEKCLAEEMGAA